MYNPDTHKLDKHEFDTHKASFTTASDRARHLMLISIIASILVFAAFRNAHQEMWIALRLDRARVASRNAVWKEDIDRRISLCRSGNLEATKLGDPCDKVEQAVKWFRASGHSQESFKSALEAMEQARVLETQLVKVPFLGIQFDINDLGTFSAMGLSMIAIVLAYSMVRYHENLYLCLWKIRRVAELEGRYDDNQSKANFLYHSLAMEQVFSRAPTLARWKNRVVLGRLPSLLLLTIPVIVQWFVFYHDVDTAPQGELFSSSLTATTIWGFEVPLFIALVVSTFITFVYAVAADKRWAATFFAINPSLCRIRHPRWLDWLLPDYFPRFRVDKDNLYVFSKNSAKVWQVEDELPDGSFKINPVGQYPENIFDLTRLKDGIRYELRTNGSSVEVLRNQPTTGLHAKRVRIGDVVPGDTKGGFTLYFVFGDQVEKIAVGETGEAERYEYMPISSRRRPRRYGRRFIDLACVGEDVFLVEPRSKNLRKASNPGQISSVRTGSIAWLPVALVAFGDRLLVAEVPIAGLRWLLRFWKPVRVRRIDTTAALSNEPTEEVPPDSRQLRSP